MYLSDEILEFKVSIDGPDEHFFEFVRRICSTSPVRDPERKGSCLRVLCGLTSVIKVEQTDDNVLVEPPVPIRIDLFWRSSTGLSESFSRLILKHSNDTIALESNATMDKDPKIQCKKELDHDFNDDYRRYKFRLIPKQ